MSTLTIDTAALRSALARILPCVPKRTRRPILENVRLTAPEAGVLELSGTDLELYGAVRVRAEVEAGGIDRLLPARDVYAVLKGRDGPLAITLSEGEAALSWDDAETATLNAPAAGLDFPESPFQASDAYFMSLDGAAFARAILDVAPFIARGDTRYTLNGIFVEPGEGCVNVVASDTHRLAQVAVPLADGGAEAGRRGLIALPSVAGIAAVLPAGPMKVILGPLGMNLVGDGFRYAVRAVDGQFPEWRHVVPAIDRDGPRLIADRRTLAAALRTVPGNYVKLSPCDGGDGLRLSTETGVGKDDYVGSAGSAVVKAFTAKMPGNMVFNRTFLADALRIADGDLITFWMRRDTGDPVVVEPRPGYTHVLMPVSGKRRSAVPPANRGAESLKAALALPDRPPAVAAPAKPPRRPRSASAASLTLDAVLSWLASAPDDMRRAIAEAAAG